MKISKTWKRGWKPEVAPQTRTEKRDEFIEQHTLKVEEIMKWVGLPSDRSEIRALAATTPIRRKANPRLKLYPDSFGLDGSQIIHIAARALSYLDEFKRAAGKHHAYAGSNNFDWAFQVGVTISELNANAHDWLSRKEPAREWLKEQIVCLFSTNRIGHSYVKEVLRLLLKKRIITLAGGTRASASSNTVTATSISWTPEGGVKTGVELEAFRKIARAAKRESRPQLRLGRG